MRIKLAAIFLVFVIGSLLVPLTMGAEPPIAPIPDIPGGPPTPPAPKPPSTTVGETKIPQEINLLVPIGGVGKIKAAKGPQDYIYLIFKYALGLAALLALAQLVFGAVQYTTSAGLPSLREDAKSRMQMAIWGLILLLITVVILQTIKTENFLAGPTIEPIPESTDGNGDYSYKGSTKEFIEQVLAKIDPKKSAAERAKQFMDAVDAVLKNGKLSLEEKGKILGEAIAYIKAGQGPFASEDKTVWAQFGNATDVKNFKYQAAYQLFEKARGAGALSSGHDFIDAMYTSLNKAGITDLDEKIESEMYKDLTQEQRGAIALSKAFRDVVDEQFAREKAIMDSIPTGWSGAFTANNAIELRRDAQALWEKLSQTYGGGTTAELEAAGQALRKFYNDYQRIENYPRAKLEAEALIRYGITYVQLSGTMHAGYEEFLNEVSDKIPNEFMRPSNDANIFRGYKDAKGTLITP